MLLTDERWVPETSDRSNARLVRQRLLTNRAGAARLLPLYSDAPEPAARLDALTEAVAAHLPLSVMLLGMGEDMHTASLFPGAENLAAALADTAPPLIETKAPGLAEPRVTLSAPVLSGALAKHIVITGSAKREALARAQELRDPMQAPICAVLQGATVHWAA